MRITAALLVLASFAWADAAAIVKKLGDKNDQIVLEGLAEAANEQSKSLTASLVKLTKHKNPAIRQTAIACLGGRTDVAAKKKAASSLAARLKPLSKDPHDKTEILLVIQALHDLAQPTTIKALLDTPNDAERDVREARAMAVANVPSKEAIERLIQYGYKDRRGEARTRDIAVRALRYATQDNTKRGIEGWRKWWSDNKKSFDPESAADKRQEARDAKAEKDAKREARKNKQGGRKGKKKSN